MLTSHNETAAADEPALVCVDGFADYHYWRGLSGKRYLHTVYSLIGCPAMRPSNYILVRRNEDGSRSPLAVGQTRDEAASLNLAQIRHEGAKLGANEVHIHLLADTVAQRQFAEIDLEAGQADRLTFKVPLQLAS